MFDELLIAAGRCFGKPRGWERVVRWFAPPGQDVKAASRVVTTPEGLKFLAEPTSYVGWYVLFFKEYEPEVRDVIASFVKPGQTALDVGANVGWHTLLLAHRVGPTGHVVSFEPNPNVRQRLEANLQRNTLEQVRVLAMALSDRSGVVRFTSPLATDLGAGDGHILTDSTASDTRPDVTQTIEVTANRLDDIWPTLALDRLDFIKIDAEGWDASVIEGGRATIQRYRPPIVFEFDRSSMSHSGANETVLRDLFDRLGYTVASIGRGGVRALDDRWPDWAVMLASPSAASR